MAAMRARGRRQLAACPGAVRRTQVRERMIDKPVSNQLTKDDVAKLMADPSAVVRAETTATIA